MPGSARNLLANSAGVELPAILSRMAKRPFSSGMDLSIKQVKVAAPQLGTSISSGVLQYFCFCPPLLPLEPPLFETWM